jgi:hypothetical protein
MYIDIAHTGSNIVVTTNNSLIDTRTIAVASVTKITRGHGNKIVIFYTPDGIHKKLWGTFDYRQIRTPSSTTILGLINTLRGYLV